MVEQCVCQFEEENDPLNTTLVAKFTWGTTVEIFATATMFGLVIYEATDSLVPGIPRWMRFSPRECNNEECR